MERKQQTILITRIMGKMGEATKEVQTLVTTDRIISANRDESDEYTWLRYETERTVSGGHGAYQNWKILETPEDLHLMTNAFLHYPAKAESF